ncbi:MAG: hypothetical protein JO184_14770 [Gammaproteobacteria bacterium]|nr:hypothetical protein [Gammaproteobacteria bacterium]
MQKTIFPVWNGASKEYQRLFDATNAARLAYFRTLGDPDSEVWSDPVTQAGPASRWPNTPAWQCIRGQGCTLIASSGLTAPFAEADGPNLGLRIETAVATMEALPTDVHATWLFELAVAVSSQAVMDGRFHLRHQRFGAFLFSVQGAPGVFRDCVDPAGTLAFLVGLPLNGQSTTINLPAGSASLLMAKLLTPAEFAFVVAHGQEGAQKLIELFAADGSAHFSSLRRDSAV